MILGLTGNRRAICKILWVLDPCKCGVFCGPITCLGGMGCGMASVALWPLWPECGLRGPGRASVAKVGPQWPGWGLRGQGRASVAKVGPQWPGWGLRGLGRASVASVVRTSVVLVGGASIALSRVASLWGEWQLGAMLE